MIELYLSGDNMAQRLPRVGPLLEPLAKKEVPSCHAGPDGWVYSHEYDFLILKQPRMRLTLMRFSSNVNYSSFLGAKV